MIYIVGFMAEFYKGGALQYLRSNINPELVLNDPEATTSGK